MCPVKICHGLHQMPWPILSTLPSLFIACTLRTICCIIITIIMFIVIPYCNCYTTPGLRNNRQKHISWAGGWRKVVGACNITGLFCLKLVVDGCNLLDCVVFLRAFGTLHVGKRISLTRMTWIYYSTRRQISQIGFDVEISKAIDTSVSTFTRPAYTCKTNAC